MSGIRYFSEVLNQKGAPALYEDTIGNRPAATFEGRLFFATDVVSGDTIFRDNGNGTWSALAGNAGGGGSFINGVTNLIGGVGLGGYLIQDTEIGLNGRSFKLTANGDNLLIDTVNDLYYFGKGGALDVGIGLHVTSSLIYFQYLTNNQGLYFDYDGGVYFLGDFDYTGINGTCLKIEDINSIIQTQYAGANKGLKLDFNINRFYIGDFDGVSNSTSIAVFDDNQNIYFYSSIGAYNFSNVPTYPNNAAAILGGLGIGDIYRSSTGGGDTLHIVH